MMVKRTYRFSWMARLFLVIVTGMWLWAVWFLKVRGSFKDTHPTWIVFVVWGLSLAFCWEMAMSFVERIVVDDDGVRFHDLFFRSRQFRWTDIKQVRSDIMTSAGDGISISVYDVVSRHHRYRWQIGLWIAHYKDLLRDILAHVPDDAQTDVNVYHAIRRRGETLEEAYRALGRARQERIRKPGPC